MNQLFRESAPAGPGQDSERRQVTRITQTRHWPSVNSFHSLHVSLNGEYTSGKLPLDESTPTRGSARMRYAKHSPVENHDRNHATRMDTTAHRNGPLRISVSRRNADGAWRAVRKGAGLPVPGSRCRGLALQDSRAH